MQFDTNQIESVKNKSINKYECYYLVFRIYYGFLCPKALRLQQSQFCALSLLRLLFWLKKLIFSSPFQSLGVWTGKAVKVCKEMKRRCSMWYQTLVNAPSPYALLLFNFMFPSIYNPIFVHLPESREHFLRESKVKSSYW